MTDDFLPEILRGFVAESRSYLASLRDLAGRDAGVSTADLGEGYRLLHCVRGAASMLELGEIAWTAGRGESLLEAASRGERPFDDEARAVLASTLEAVELALGDLEVGLPPAPEEMAPIATSAPVAAVRDSGDGTGDVLEGFLEEAEEHLAALGEALRELEREPGAGAAALREIRRRIHTLKGTAAMVGFGEVARLCHALEDALERPDGRDRAAWVHEAVDLLENLVRQSEAPEAAERVAPLVLRLRAGSPPEREAESPKAPAVPEVPEPVSLAVRAPVPPEQVRVPLERVDALVRVASELVVQRSVLERVHRELGRQAGELGLSLRRLSGLSGRLETDYEAAALTGASGTSGAGGRGAAPGAEFDELELDRYTAFHLLTRGLAETVSDVQAVGTELAGTTSEFEGFLQRQQRLLRELQDHLLRLRAVPLATLAGRLHRTVRVTAERCGKQAALVFEGESVELDKSLLEAVADPLLHLVRNAVAHGVEPAEARRAAGKPEEGTVRVTARYQGGQAVLEVADDGAGVDLAAVRAAGADLGLPGDQLSEEEALSLLFLPGFTTARAVSEVAGRGVGLDAVRAQVEALRGTVTAGSDPGRGARFTVRLPLSLAITRALLVEAAGAPFAVPAAAVSRILRLEAGDVRQDRFKEDGDDALVTLDGEDLPVRPLRDILRLGGGPGPAEARPLALVLDLGDHRAAVLVDRLIESRDVVVKPLGPLLRRVDGLAGATLLGDGSVVPILDPYTFPRWELGAARRPLALPEREVADAGGPLEVLIVDDSLSVRRVLSNLAGNAGWVPLTARDGLEALEVLQARRRPPGVILLDIEMPRMDGYELAATLRGLPLYAGIPIVMLTSRAGEKHREKALGLGASEYLVKPFQPEVLVHVVERLAFATPGRSGAPAAAGPAPS